MHAQEWLPLEVEHEVEALAAGLIVALEVDCSDRAARDDALAMILAAVEIDLIAPVDRIFGAHLDAGVAARANIEIDGIVLRPRDLERAQPARDAFDLAGVHRIVALLRQLDASRIAGDEHGDREMLVELLRPRQDRTGGADDEQLAFGLERDARNRRGLRQCGGGKQGRDLGRRQMRLRRPARRLADIDKANRLRLSGVVGNVAQETRFLRARDQHVARCALGERTQLLLAQLGVQRHRAGKLERARKRGCVERHGAVAATKVELLVANAHRSSSADVPASSGGLAACAASPAGAAIAFGSSGADSSTGESITCPSALISVFGGSKM